MARKKEKGEEFQNAWDNLKKEHKTYGGLVPLLEDANLSCSARILFHIISSLSYVEGYCFATNETLGKKLGLKTGMVKKYLKELKENELIEVRMIPLTFGFQRQVYVSFEGVIARYASIAKKS